jgi:hypothetical protein
MMEANYAEYFPRLATYTSWPFLHLGCYPSEMADDGLFYTREGDIVKCFSCGVVIGNWHVGDNVRNRHQQASPGCELVQQSTNFSEPIGLLHTLNTNINFNEHDRTDAGNGDVTDACQSIITSNNVGVPSRNTAESNSYRNTPAIATTLNNSAVSRDRTDGTSMKHEAARFATFNTWPKPDIVTPESLAREGFFYKGFGDNTECAFCGGVLRAWESGDDPKREHKISFPMCPFVCGQDVGNVPIARRGQYPVDPREIKARLDTPQVQMFLSQGYSLDVIRTVLEERLRTHGKL